jgi:hypothetical protein
VAAITAELLVGDLLGHDHDAALMRAFRWDRPLARTHAEPPYAASAGG